MMAENYYCFICMKVAPLLGSTEKKCPLCGGTKGEVISQERYDEGVKSGVFFNIDPKTGKRAKERR